MSGGIVREVNYADLGREVWGVDGIWRVKGGTGQWQMMTYTTALDPQNGGNGNVQLRSVSRTQVRIDNNRPSSETIEFRLRVW